MPKPKLHDLIGPARRAADILLAKCGRLRDAGEGVLKVLLWGPPGTGKTTVANLVAAALADHKLAIESTNGANVNAEFVRQIAEKMATSCLWSDWRVLVVNEADKMSPQAEVLLLTVLDELPERRACLFTSNLAPQQMSQRFQSRLQQFELGVPQDAEIYGHIISRWGVPKSVAISIVKGAAGDVRMALNDAETYADRVSFAV